MKKLLIVMLFWFGLFGTSHAILIDNGDGTVTQIRNDGSRLMWFNGYPYFNPGELTWNAANNAIAHFNTIKAFGYDDWRLPRILPVNGATYDWTLSYDGSTDWGYNIISPNSEWSYLFYVELENQGLYDTEGGPQYRTDKTGLFGNAMADKLFWSESEVYYLNQGVMRFSFDYGKQDAILKSLGTTAYIWPVRDMEPLTDTVEIDIKPGSDSNPINPNARGMVPVAILSAEDFDATTIDPDTVAFGPDGAAPMGENAHVEDVNEDGLEDLVFLFWTWETGITFGDVEACITGETFDGAEILSCDEITTLPPFN